MCSCLGHGIIFPRKKNSEIPGKLRELSICRESLCGRLGGKACFYLFNLFIYSLFCLFMYLLYIYFKGAVYHVMHFCVWALWRGSHFYKVVAVGLLQDVIDSLPSFLTYCYHCLYLLKLLLSIASVYKPVYWFGMQIGVLVST